MTFNEWEFSQWLVWNVLLNNLHLEDHLAIIFHPTPQSKQVLAHPTARCERSQWRARLSGSAMYWDWALECQSQINSLLMYTLFIFLVD